jgi:NADH dehydrogenase
VGTLEPNSLTESTRKLAKRKDARYLQLEAYDVNFEDKEVVLQDQDGRNFHLPYDKLVIAVGSQSTTFNVPGVQDNCVFLKSLDDAVRIRSIILSNFERASLPTTTDTERARLLSFAVCGGGPTGTELLAELHDFIHDDLLRYFPTIRPSDIRLSIIQSQDHILNTYDKAISEYCEKQFKRNNINVLVNARVTRVEPHHVLYTEKGDPSKEEKSLDVGMCLWATGIDMIPFTKRIKQRLHRTRRARSLWISS